MKLCSLMLSLLIALPFAAQAQTKVIKTTIHGRTVTVITETKAQPAAACQLALDQHVARQGWHDHIYRTAEGNQAMMIFSQRDTGCVLTTTSWFSDVKITLWKAVEKNGKTLTETRVYRLSPSEVNNFLDTELRDIAVEFTSSPIRAS